MELCSILCGGLDGREVWGRMDTCICLIESLCCPYETIKALLTGYTPVQNKKLKKKQKTKTKKKKHKTQKTKNLSHIHYSRRERTLYFFLIAGHYVPGKRNSFK